MQLLDHLSISVRDSAKRFYKAVLGALDASVAYEREDAIGFGERNRPHDDAHTYISVYQSAHAASDPRRHWCFRAQSRAQVRAYHADYYAAFLLDPEGNKVEAVTHRALA